MIKITCQCIFLAALLRPMCACGAETVDNKGPQGTVQEIDIVHCSHTDYGFTDHPAVCRDLEKRYLDIALDAALRTRSAPPEGRFCWTAETTIAVNDWWQAALPPRRAEFLQAVKSGQLEVAALPLNQTATLGSRQWQTMLHWLDEDLWQQLQPSVAIQNDVNGVPRAGAVALLDRGVRYLFSGLNEDSGRAPMRRPAAFWWKMPDGRRILVYLNYAYPAGYGFFEEHKWRQGPLPKAGDTRYRPPRPGDIFRSDEESLRKSHRHLLTRLRGLEAEGYSYPLLVISITNQWRIDNDPPFPPLAEFVGAWNHLGLKPALRLTTASVAMKKLEATIGSRIPEYQGEWTDWWSNGVASGPREVAASRLGKRLLLAAESPLWGELDARARQSADLIWRDLCLFDEHTWGSGDSVALPYSLDTQGQYSEKANLAYRSMARAEWFLSQRVRTRLIGRSEGLYLANTAAHPFTGWVRLPSTCFRSNYLSLDDPLSGAKSRLVFESGYQTFVRPQRPEDVSFENTAATFSDRVPGQVAKFWVEKLEGGTVHAWRLSPQAAAEPSLAKAPVPTVCAGAEGWPESIVWPGMSRPLFLPGLGDFCSIGVRGFAPRWVIKDIWAIGDSRQRDKARSEKLFQIDAVAAEKTVVEDDPHTIVYTQTLRHPRLQWAVRRLEAWKTEPRVRFTLRFNRISSEAPEAFFVAFPLPCEGALPRASGGGLAFVPFQDQLPGTCRDYFAIDGWVHYQTPSGNWLWVSRDAPLVAFGAPQLLARRQDTPRESHRIEAMIFNNFWHTNFVADSHGVMEFRFDLIWSDRVRRPDEAAAVAEALLAEPQVFIQPGLKEDPIVIERLYRP